MKSAKKLKFFSVQHRGSKHFSSRMIVYDKNLDHNKHLEFISGEHAQALDELNKKRITNLDL